MSREAFEKWARDNKYVIDINEDGLYEFTATRLAFEAWQACEAEQSKRIAELIERGKRNARIADKKTKTIAELKAQNAELVEALKLCKVTFISNKLDVRNVMEVINKALGDEYPYEVFDIDGDVHYLPKGENGKHMFHAICRCKPTMATQDCANGFEVWHNKIDEALAKKGE